MDNDKTISFKDAWTQTQELIEDPETGDEYEDTDVIKESIRSRVSTWNLPEGSDTEEFMDMVQESSREFYFSEYASNAPGGRSSHRSESKKYGALAKNRLRVLFGMKPKGLEEMKEIDEFLRTKGHLFTTEYSRYTPVGSQVKMEIMDRFGLPGGLSGELVGYCESVHGLGKHPSEWNLNLLEYSGLRLHRVRSKKSG